MKILIRVLLVAVVFFALAVAAVGFFADGAARRVIERGGSYALGVPTTLGGADIGIFSGHFGLSELAVANPEGFAGEHFFTLDAAGLELSLGQMSAEEIRVPELSLDGVFVELARSGGETNYGKILEHLEGLKSGAEEPATGGEEAEGEGGPLLVFDRIVIRNVEARVSLIPIGGDTVRIPVYIEEFVLTDVGADGSGVTVAQVFDQVIRALLYTVIKTAGDVLPADLIQDLGGRLGDLDALGIDVTGLVSAEVAGKAVELGADFGELGARLEGALGGEGGDPEAGLGKKVEDAVEGLGGLFGGKPDD
jgi:hypothetical protein